MSENLSKLGLFLDELNKIRVCNSESSTQSANLKEECRDFVDKITEYQQITDDLIRSANELATHVNQEKLQVLQLRNRLKCTSEQRVSQQQQLQTRILEKRAELDRIQADYRALQQTEQEQKDLALHLSQH